MNIICLIKGHGYPHQVFNEEIYIRAECARCGWRLTEKEAGKIRAKLQKARKE